MMQTTSSHFIQGKRGILSLLAILPVVLLNAFAYQVPTSGTAWTAVGTVASKSMPSGLRVSVGVTGSGQALGSLTNTTLQTSNTLTSPALPAATNGAQVIYNSNATCGTTALTCAGLGTLTFQFKDAAGNLIPVRNPVIHMARLGGSSSSGGSGFKHGAVLKLTSSGATLSLGTGARGFKLTTTTTTNDTIRPDFTVFPATPLSATAIGDCTASPNAPQAGCGSIPVTGTVSSLSFDVSMIRDSAPYAWIQPPSGTGTPSYAADGIYFTVTADEDFGDAPTSFDPTQAASHIVGDLALGSSVDPENLSTLASTTSPNAVAAAANNNGVNGDGAEEDAISSFVALNTNSSSYSLSVPISGASQAGRVCGWIDFNRDNVFGTATFERACGTFAANATSVTLNWTGISGLSAGNNYVRLRAAYAAADFNPTGQQNSGEVEDYQLTITAPPALVTVTGTVWNDNDASVTVNGNPLEAGTNPGGLTVYVVDANGKVVDKATVTATGTYTLSSIPVNSSLTLRLSTDSSIAVGSTPALLTPSLPSGWVNTGENKNGTSETITPGDIAITTTTANLSGLDFGIAQPSVSATVWIDLNRNGVRDNNEAIWDSSTASLTLYLTDANNVVIAKGTLRADGGLNFFGIAAGTYTLIVSTDPSVAIGSQAPAPSLPSGWGTTGENTGNAATGTLDGTPDTKITVVIP